MKNGPQIDEFTVKGGDPERAPEITSQQPVNVYISNAMTGSDSNRKQISRRKKGGGGDGGNDDDSDDDRPGSDGP